jgi:hypothetical protein
MHDESILLSGRSAKLKRAGGLLIRTTSSLLNSEMAVFRLGENLDLPIIRLREKAPVSLSLPLSFIQAADVAPLDASVAARRVQIIVRRSLYRH